MSRGPHFASGDPTRAGIEFDPTTAHGGVFVTVTDYPYGSAYVLDRAETARLRDWLTDHLNQPDRADLSTFYIARPDGYLWLHHAPDPDDPEGHPVGIEVDAGTTLAELIDAARAHTCEKPTE